MNTQVNTNSSLYEMIKELGAANNLKAKTFESQWPIISDFDYVLLERQAERFNKTERVLFVDGEQRQMEKLAYAKKARYLNKFLNQIFDGPLHNTFYEN